MKYAMQAGNLDRLLAFEFVTEADQQRKFNEKYNRLAAKLIRTF